MMRKYFPLEASERLFVAIEEDDVVDAQVSLPPTIALSCTTEIIHDNYALCLAILAQWRQSPGVTAFNMQTGQRR